MIPGGVRAIAGKATGRFYFEAVHQYGTSPGSAIGVADATASEILGLGADTHGYGVYPSGAVYHSGLSVGAVTPFGLGDTVGLAVDVTSKLMWARVNSGVWNADPTADPGAGTGGISIANLVTVFPMCTVQAAAPAIAGYTTGAVHFDGSTWLANAALTAADTPLLSYSIWVKASVLDNVLWVVDPLGAYVSSDELAGGSLDYGFTVANFTSSNVFRASSGASSITTGVWYNLKVSIKTDLAAGLKTAQIYIGDTSLGSVTQDTNGAFSMAFSGLPFYVGNDASGNMPLPVQDMSDSSWWVGTLIDWAVEANRRAVYSATGKPVDPAVANALFGTPTVQLLGGASTFATNTGSGGAFAVTGSLTNAATSPSD